MGKGGGDSSGCETKNNSITKGMGKKKRKSGKKEPWMEVQINRKKPKTSKFIYLSIKFIFLNFLNKCCLLYYKLY